MIRRKRQRGYVETLGRDYNFTYDNDLLQLVPRNKEEIKSYDFIKNKNMDFEILEGINERNEKLFFLNCSLYVDGSGYIAKPAGYICTKNNNGTFNTITFKGGIIDYFYRCNQIVDEKNSNYNCETGEAVLKLFPFDKTTKEKNIIVCEREATLTLSITMPALPIYIKEDYNLGKPETILRITFKEGVPIEEFRNIYMYIYNLMIFLNFRRDISMGDISLGKINEDQKVEEIAYTYFAENPQNTEFKMDPDNIIGYYFVENNINELLKIVNEPKLNLLFIPKDKKSAEYITPEDYMVCCTSFESVFNYIFPNARTEYKQMANEVKKDLLEYIEQEENKYKGNDGKRRKKYKKYKDMIEFLDFSLPEKFERCQSEYAFFASGYGQIMRNKFKLSDEEMKKVASEFGKKRNMLMHNSIEQFKEIHIVAYLMARRFIYAMIMKKSGISNSMIREALNKILI